MFDLFSSFHHLFYEGQSAAVALTRFCYPTISRSQKICLIPAPNIDGALASIPFTEKEQKSMDQRCVSESKRLAARM